MLIAAIGAVVVPLKTARAGNGRLIIAVLIFVPVVAAGFYAGLGTPDAATTAIDHKVQSQIEASRSSHNPASNTVGSVASMIEGLKSRLESEPDDAGSWLLLAKSYQHLGQTEDANAAYERARALGKIDAAFEQSVGSVGSPEEAPAADIGPALRGRVSLSADAAALVEPGDTVFIFAKESIEQRMPIVALRRPATEFPLQFTLTDRDAMVAGTSLANFEQLVVTAKISRSGLATEVVAGLEAWSDPVSPLDNQTIELQIGAAPVGGRNE